MACPVCDYTMQNLGVPPGRTFWCPRCGTLKIENSGGTYECVEHTIWVRRIIGLANLLPRASNASQNAPTPVLFLVEQKGLEPPTVTFTEKRT
jgi:hypothetical protein